jgi:hypothetical protein
MQYSETKNTDPFFPHIPDIFVIKFGSVGRREPCATDWSRKKWSSGPNLRAKKILNNGNTQIPKT